VVFIELLKYKDRFMKNLANILGFIGIELFFCFYFSKVFKLNQLALICFLGSLMVSTCAVSLYLYLKRKDKMV
jgi:hypothetical protein